MKSNIILFFSWSQIASFYIEVLLFGNKWVHNNVLLWSALNLFKPNCPNHTAVDAIKSRAVCPRFIWIWFKLTFFQVAVPVPRNTATASAFSSTWYSFAFQMFFLYLLSKRSYTFPFLESSTVYDVIGLGEIKYDTFISNIQSQRSELLGSVVTWHLWAFSVQIFNILTKIIYPQCCPNIKPEMAKSQISSRQGCQYCLALYMAASLEFSQTFYFLSISGFELRRIVSPEPLDTLL